MRGYVFIVSVLIIGICLAGCRKKESALELPEPMSMEALSAVTTEAELAGKAKLQEAQPVVTGATGMPLTALEPMPLASPSRPTPIEIQTALKNAGYYASDIDGKIGPLTRKAIEEFQKANGLQADGKVGQKTWAVLMKHLQPAAEQPVTKAAKKR